MKSTDMFSSAHSRSFSPEKIILPDQNAPQGVAVSPYIISLWEEKTKILHQQKTEQQMLQETREEKISSFSSQKKEEIKNSHEFQNHPTENFSLHHLPETEKKIPSREDQIEKVKQAMKQFEEFSKTSSSRGNKGFFRNLKNFLG